MSASSILVIAGHSNSLVIFRWELINELIVRGNTVHVAGPNLDFNSSVRKKLEQLGVVVHDIALRRTGLNPWVDFCTLVQLWRLMCKIKPISVLAYTVKPVIYGTLAAWLAKVPHRFALITGLGYAFQDASHRSLLYFLVRSLYSAALSKAHKVFFQNPDDLDLFLRRKLISSRLLTCVVNGSGVDVDKFSLAAFPVRPIRFLLIARLLGDKGLREYVNAASAVRKLVPETQFFLVGGLDENPDSIKQSELDVWVAAGDITYLGSLGDVRPAIANCHVYVLPSYREGTPRTVLEAMAMGRPVITTNAPGCRETVVNGENGFLVSVKSTEELQKAMMKFIENPSFIARMGQKSRQIAEEKYDVHKVNAVMLSEMGY